MIESVAFFVYPVSDVPRAREFYENVLGLKLETDFGGEWIEYDVGGGTFAITTMDANHVPGAKGGAIAFEVADLDRFVNQLKERRVNFVMEITTSPVCRFAIVSDPDGNQVIIHKRHQQVT